ncbi:MAG: glycosyltransferase family 1 protein [Mucilaginibacter sp.]
MIKKPLTIGVDVRVARVAKTGIRSYLGELRKEFENLAGDDLCFHFLDTSFPIYTGNNKLLKWIGHFRYQLWKQLILPIKAWSKKCDIVFCVDDCVPYIHLNYKTVATIHDAFFFESPDNYGKLWLWLYENTAIPAAKRSSFVITKTFYGKKQIVNFTTLAPDKLIVVYDGGPKRVDHHETANNPNQFLKSLSVTPTNYILHVGAMFKRKNLVALVNAFAEIKKTGYPELKLVLAGPLSTSKFDNDYESILNAIEKHDLKNAVVIPGYLTDVEVEELYNSALMYVFPSLNEGFGLGVLEGFSHNLPVLVANNTCLQEVGGDAVLSFDPYNVGDIADKIHTVLQDTGLQKKMISMGQQRLKDFSWQATAKQIVDIFKKATLIS